MWYGKTATTSNGKIGRVIGTGDCRHWCIVVEFQDGTIEILPPWCFEYPKKNKTATHWASSNRHFEVVKVLLEAGADVHTANDDAFTTTDATTKQESNIKENSVHNSNHNPENDWVRSVFNTKLSLLESRATRIQDLGVILIVGSAIVTGVLFYFIGPLSFAFMVFSALGAYLIKDSSKVINGIKLINKYKNDELAINVIRSECFSQSTNIWFGRVGK